MASCHRPDWCSTTALARDCSALPWAWAASFVPECSPVVPEAARASWGFPCPSKIIDFMLRAATRICCTRAARPFVSSPPSPSQAMTNVVETGERFAGPLQRARCLQPVHPCAQHVHGHGGGGIGAIDLSDPVVAGQCLLESAQFVQHLQSVDR